MGLIQIIFGHPKTWGTFGMAQSPTLFCSINKSFFFKLVMQNYCQNAMLPPHNYNLAI
jgi:hypothetical protein